MIPTLQGTIAEGEGVQIANTLNEHAAEWGPGSTCLCRDFRCHAHRFACVLVLFISNGP